MEVYDFRGNYIRTINLTVPGFSAAYIAVDREGQLMVCGNSLVEAHLLIFDPLGNFSRKWSCARESFEGRILDIPQKTGCWV